MNYYKLESNKGKNKKKKENGFLIWEEVVLNRIRNEMVEVTTLLESNDMDAFLSVYSLNKI